MKAVVALNRLHRRVKKSPKMIMQEFEKELGVVEGQAWSIKDWLKKQPWGKFKGLYRSAMMDAAAYELVRNGDPQAAGAQLVQNMKAKLQCVLQGSGPVHGNSPDYRTPCPVANGQEPRRKWRSSAAT